MSDAPTLDAPARALSPAPFAAMSIEAPLGLLAEITHRCPLQCPYCSNPVALERPESELTAAEWGRVFEEAARLGIVQLHLSGGEPLARRDATEIVAHARAAGLYVNLITAAVNLTPERADALAAAGVDHVQISLQDSDAESCGRITAYPKAFEKKIEAARLVTERGLPLTVNAVIHRANIGRVGDLISLAERLGAHRIEIAHTQYYGWAYRNRAALMPDPGQVEAASRTVEAAREALRGRLLIDYVVPDYFASLPKPCMGGWGRQFLVVTPKGDVLPCHAAPMIPGLAFDNVREQSLGAIWRGSAAFNRFRGEGWMPEPCRSCARREEDFGGCRCQAFMLTGDAANTDPACALSPHHDAMRRFATEVSGDAPPGYIYRRYG